MGTGETARRIVLAVTGASGAAYAVTLLEALAGLEQCAVTLVVSDAAREIIPAETDADMQVLEGLADEVVDNANMNSWLCSGSRHFDAMVVVPCSMTTLGKLAAGIGDNVITRAGSVALKERRSLILVPRETPLGQIHIRNMLDLSSAGAIILPAMPGFYGNPRTVQDLVDFVAARILDILGLDSDLGPRWASGD